jgi:cyclopropane fatty-acyl-phospholipid synthase-like methyltransferase
MGTVTGHPGWRAVWQAKGAAPPPLTGEPDQVVRRLMALAGYDSATSSLDPETHYVQVRYVLDRLDIRPTDTVYEVGCGAGSMLYSLRPACAAVGGSDFADSLVALARQVLGAADLAVLEANAVPPEPAYDVVLSNGVFIYFPDPDYARQVVHRMVAKARRAVGVLDVNDAATRAEFEAVRQARQGPRRAGYGDLAQLYLDREFFHRIADELDLACRTEDSVMTNSANGRYRFNALLFKPDPPERS